jgi:hypothetical protein
LPWVELGTKNKKIDTLFGSFWLRECWHPRRQAVLSSVFHVCFVFITAFVVFSCFIGAVTGGMADAISDFEKQEKEEKAIKSKQIAESIDPQ